MSDILFTKVDDNLIEGYLGDGEDAEILFILKEPNTKNVESDDGFWFKKVISDENRTSTGKRYFNILGCLAEKLLSSTGSKTELLKKCAYINLYPFSGLDRASENYKNVLNEFDKFINTPPKMHIDISKKSSTYEISSAEDIAKNRVYLINQIIMSGKTKYIVTVGEIYNILSHCDYTNSYLQLKYGRKPKTKDFACHKLTKDSTCHELTKEVKLCEFWHPSYTWINYDYLNKAKPTFEQLRTN